MGFVVQGESKTLASSHTPLIFWLFVFLVLVFNLNGRLELLFYAQNEDAGGKLSRDGTFYVQAVLDLKNPKPRCFFPYPSSAQQQEFLAGMEMTCRWRTTWRMPQLKLKKTHTTPCDVFTLGILRVFFKVWCVSWVETQMHCCNIKLLQNWDTQKDFTFPVTPVKILNPDTPHHLGQLRRQKWSVVTWTHL